MNKIKIWIKEAWNKLKQAAGWKNVGSIVIARMTMLAGLVTGGIGMMDWSPIFSLLGVGTTFDSTQVAIVGGITFLKGLLDEVVRRWKATVEDLKAV